MGTSRSALGKHIRVHGLVHAIWLTCVLLAIIAALVLMLPNGNSVGEYISFSASIASLVLAVVAIGQSLIANQSFSETVGSLRMSANNIQSSTELIRSVSSALHDKTDTMIDEFKNNSSTIQQISAKFDQAYASRSEESTKNTEDHEDFFSGYMTNGLRLTFYVIGLAYKYGKLVDLDTMFEDRFWRAHVGGAISALEYSEFRGIKIIAVGDSFRIESLGSLALEEFVEVFDHVPKDKLNTIIGTVKDYFETGQVDAPEESGSTED